MEGEREKEREREREGGREGERYYYLNKGVQEISCRRREEGEDHK